MTDPISLDFAVVTFEPIKEGWNEYSFSDHTIVKFRTIVTRIVKHKNTPIGQYDISFNNVNAVYSPPQNRGQPTNILQEELEKTDKFEVQPITSAEPWNEYRLIATDDVLKVKYVANAFYKIKDKFDQFGEPVYMVLGSPLITPQLKTSKFKHTP